MSVAALIMWAAAATATTWKGSQLARMPRDRGLQIVTICTVLVLTALTAQLAVSIPSVGEQFPRGTPILIEFVLLTFFFATLLVLLRSTTPGTTRGRDYFEIALSLAVSAGLTATFLATQATSNSAYSDYSAGTTHVAGVLVFHCLGNAYMAYATGRGAYLAWTSSGQVQRHTLRGLRVAAVGLILCCLGAHVPRVISTGSRLILHADIPPGTEMWTAPCLALGVATFFLGVAYPGARTGLVKARMWFVARSRIRQLRPLWDALQQQFPTIALYPPESATGERLHIRQMRLRYYRRMIECRDGLVCLSPYMSSALHDTDSPHRQALLVRDALALVRRTAVTESAVPSPIAAPDASGMEADVLALLALAHEFTRLSPLDAATSAGALEGEVHR